MKTHIRNIFPMGLLLALGLFAATLSPAQAFFGLSIGIAPPPLPVYAQPVCPGDGYIWVPGYWAWSTWSNDYYWVPGTWALAPEAGLLWTPGYWGCDNGAYFFNSGYWGSNVGFYGGIDYGHGYFGRGYGGGYWRNGHFFYNRAVNNVTNVGRGYVYSRSVADRGGSRVSYNGGAGGIAARPNADEIAAGREHHVDATSAQVALDHSAASNPSLRYGENHGHPSVLATNRAGEFHSSSVGTSDEVSHRTAAESSFTGESHVAATSQREHVAQVNTAEHRALASTESHRAATEVRSVSHAPAYHAEAHAPSFHAASHAPAFHAAAHASAAHASAGHSTGPGRK